MPAAATKPLRTRSAELTLRRVQEILERVCQEDGQGANLQETSRRKAYRVGINRALDEIRVRR